MRIKNLKLSLLILAGLVIASYAFLISAQEGFNSSSNVFSETSNSTGLTTESDTLTSQVARELSTLATNTDSDGQVSLDQLKNIINNSLEQSFSEDDLPSIDPSEIKIKEQNYKGTAAEIKAKKKEDFTNYMVGVYYIFASSSPKPITNSDDLQSFSNYVTQAVVNSLTNRNSSQLNELSQSGQKMLDQLKDVEVPEDLLEIHVKALKFSKYAVALKPAIDTDSKDPLGDLVNISKMESFVQTLVSFSQEAETKFKEYGVDYDKDIKDKLESLGVDAPDLGGFSIDSFLNSTESSESSE